MTKKGNKPRDLPYMEVTWLDASSEDGWVDKDTDLSPPEMLTRGWLYKETDTYLVLVNTLRQNADGEVGGSNSIPKGMITSSRKLKVSNASKQLRRKLHPEPGAEELHREQSES